MTSTPIAVSALSAGRFRSSAATHVGTVRTRNEDNFVNRPDLGVWAVADGAGGHQAGEVAAAMVAEALGAVPGGLGAAQLLHEARARIVPAHDLLRAEAARRGARTRCWRPSGGGAAGMPCSRRRSGFCWRAPITTPVWGRAIHEPTCCAGEG